MRDPNELNTPTPLPDFCETETDFDERMDGVKLKINAILWEHLNGSVTLDTAESIACNIYTIIGKSKPTDEE